MTVKAQQMWVNPCGGTPWKTHRNHRIEIPGEGFPEYAPGTGKHKMLAQTWRNFGKEFRAAGKRHNLPPSWLAALATKESGHLSHDPGLQATAQSPTGPVGVMQFASSAARQVGMDPAQRTNPAANIEMAAKLLHWHAGRQGMYEFPALASAYNEGGGTKGVRCTTVNRWGLMENPSSNYIYDAIKLNNTAIALGYNSMTPLMAVGVGVALAAVVAGGGWALQRHTRYDLLSW